MDSHTYYEVRIVRPRDRYIVVGKYQKYDEATKQAEFRNTGFSETIQVVKVVEMRTMPSPYPQKKEVESIEPPEMWVYDGPTVTARFIPDDSNVGRATT